MRSAVSVLQVSLLAAVAAGCSISDSISSPFSWSSDSIASSSRSSSRNRAEDYRNDVADYTQAQVQSGGDFPTFTRGLGAIAAKHGVSDWESDSNTYVGIGQGLKRAGVTQTQVDVWETNLSHGDKSKASAIQSGYDSTPPGR
jgi:hypothetical protein